METIIERDVHHDDTTASSSMTMIVAIVAIVIVAGLGFFAYQKYYVNAAATPQTLDINVNNKIPANPTPTPGSLN